MIKQVFMNRLSSKKYKSTRKNIHRSENGVVIDLSDREEKKSCYGKPLLIFFCLLFICAGVIYTAGLVFKDAGKTDAQILTEEEDEKNELLLSDQTDYSGPQKAVKVRIREYIVKKGDTLSGIAQKYGVSIDTICGSSNLRSYDLIRQGAVLNIPDRDGILYPMKKGNRLVAIAKKYRVPLSGIIEYNDLKNPDFVAEGKVLFIPDAKPQNIIPGFLWPTRSRVITCGYGWRRSPFNRKIREFHHGMDIRARYSWIRSTKYGRVTFAGWLRGYGKAVIVAHPGKWKTLYGHLSKIIVKKGQFVKQGQYIAKSGNTGRSTGPHLHFEIIKNGRHKNPYRYLKRGR